MLTAAQTSSMCSCTKIECKAESLENKWFVQEQFGRVEFNFG